MDGWMDALGFLPPSAVISCYPLRFPADSEVEGRRGGRRSRELMERELRMREGGKEGGRERERERLIRSDLRLEKSNDGVVVSLSAPSLPSISLFLFLILCPRK
ncbi:uncharacterized protein AKAW2_11776A [Aspergillus luchuensis]|uniref:Uncharacterized protein n=1 Tax=Aspergillus kawachii TaxID=1069201 RepID=A0A7R7ZU35_ASPKA|nr:uncharacterized protein AKAW2_11776A [Aspergillus luchuensis]BCR94730.1 hypothetical protein AKAW2_11776A [Aspergillus luchuensis]